MGVCGGVSGVFFDVVESSITIPDVDVVFDTCEHTALQSLIHASSHRMETDQMEAYYAKSTLANTFEKHIT